MNELLITIGITCFNAEKTIERAICSALAQNWKYIEILVADDASTDCSRDIVQQIADNDSRVRLLERTENGGPAAARNTILHAACGEYVVFFDDDDESTPDRLMIQYKYLSEYERKHPKVPVCCYASGQRLYPNGYRLDMPAIGSQPKVPVGDAVVDYLLFNGRHAGVFYGAGTPTCALMLRRNLFEQFGGFDEELRRVEDGDLAIRIALNGGHFIGCKEALFLQHSTVSSDKTPKKNLDSELKIINKYSEYLHKKSLYFYATHWVRLRFFHFNKRRGLFFYTLIRLLLLNPLRTIKHLLMSSPKRLLHERKMVNIRK
jgi:glycosyltransferase involved in cell wall biosynthesis